MLSGGCCLAVVMGFSLRGLLGCRAQALRRGGFSSCAPWVQLPCGIRDHPRPGIKPVFPALAGGFQPTEHQEDPKVSFFDVYHTWCGRAQSLFSVPLFPTKGTVAHQAPLSMGFSRQEYWSGLPCLPPGDLSDPGIELPVLYH